MNQTTPSPQPAPPAEDATRVNATARRRRMLTGAWKDDARAHIHKHYSRETLEYLPPPSISRCPLKNLTGQVSTLYDVSPFIETPFGDPNLIVSTRLRALWPQVLMNVNGLNECLVRVDRLKNGQIAYRAVTPDCVTNVVPDADYPDVPVALRELRWVKRKGFEGWAYEIWSVEVPEDPMFRIVEVGKDGTLTEATNFYYPEAEAGFYPCRDLEGNAFLPYTLYHQRLNGQLFNFMEGEEVIDGTLDVAMWTTCANQGMRDLAYPQRVMIDLEIKGAKQSAGNAGQKAQVSPLTVLQMMTVGSNGQGRIDAWESSFNAVDSVTALDLVEASVNSFAGLTAADMHVSAASSGAARVISKEGLRRVRLARELTQRLGDQDLLSRASRLFNAGQGSVILPEDPQEWQITYQELEPMV